MKKSLTLLTALLVVATPVLAQNAAVVNGKAIPKSKLDNLIARSGQSDSPEIRERARNMLIDRELFLQEAEKRGLHHRDDVREQLEQARLNVLVGALMDEYVNTNGVSDEELKTRYEAIKAQAGQGKEYRARHILVEKEAEAKAAIARISGGAPFETVAKEVSKDPGSAANGGDLDWADPDAYVPEFSKALQALQKGAMTEKPVKSQFGYHIIQLDDVRDVKVPTLEEVKPQLLQMLQQDQNWQREKFEQLRKSLHSKARIQ